MLLILVGSNDEITVLILVHKTAHTIDLLVDIKYILDILILFSLDGLDEMILSRDVKM